MKIDFLIVAALEQESKGRFETLGYPVLYTGVGKLNATISLLRFLSGDKPKYILNLGTACSVTHKAGTVLQVSRFIQRDMLCEPLAPKYCTPYENKNHYIDLKVSTWLENVTCGTGDSFLSSFHIGDDYEIADMEGYALAKVCNTMNIPFFSVKYISDSGDSKEWIKSLDKASIALTEAGNTIIQYFEEIRY